MQSKDVKNGYFTRLDGLRFVAFLAVFLEHGLFVGTDSTGSLRESIVGKVTMYGYLGVDFFFVLSAFLLSFLAAREIQNTGKFDLKRYYKKRAMRVLPLYYLVLLLATMAWLVDHYYSPGVPEGWSGNPFYSYGFLFLNYFMENVGTQFWFWLTFMWTVCVEVHFYLLSGLIFRFRSKQVLQIFVAMMVVGVGYKLTRKVIWDVPTFFDTLNYLPHFGIGGAIGWLVGTDKWKDFELSQWKPTTQWLVGMILTGLVVTHLQWRAAGSIFYALDSLVYAAFFAWIICSAVLWKHRIWTWCELSGLRYLGKISYGLYAYHGGVLTAAVVLGVFLDVKWWLASVIALSATILAGVLSFHWLEKPLARLGRK